MNWRRGLFRIWAVASVSWLIAWAWYVWQSCNDTAVIFAADIGMVTMCYTGISGWQSRDASFSALGYASIIATGVSAPLAVLVAGYAARWAISGFRAS